MEKQRSLGNGPEPSEFGPKLKIFIIFALLVASIILVRLWYLQVIKGDELKQRSENNSVRFRKVKPLRGLIMDRNGQVLVDNRPSFDVLYMPNKGRDHDLLLERLSGIYGSKSLELYYDQPIPKSIKSYLPLRLEKNVGMQKVALVETNSLNLPGVYIDVTPVRLYVDGDVIAPVVGYTGEISQEELEKGTDEYLSGDIIGKNGLEKFLDGYIRGQRGAELVEVNVSGKEIKSLGRIDPVSGNNVVLTIDASLQKVAWDAFAGRAGAAIALDPRDGSILAMISSPSFDPNLFNSGISSQEWDKLQKDPRNPLSNRTISGQYPPGSTYKMIVAVAALEEGIITPETKIFCGGSFELGNRKYRCWKKEGHGWVNLHRAIVESCDVYFYTVGKMLGVDKIAHYARLFGLGEATGIDLFHEKSGLVPTREWKLARLKEPWQLGETISISIGQGFNLLTPLQLANAYAALANGGTLWRPRLVTRIEASDGSTYKEFFSTKKSELGISKETMEIIRQGLWGVVNEPGGTGAAARRPQADVCGKTGTAQVIGMQENDKTRRPKKAGVSYQDHALFVCFAPLKNPEIAIAVIVEHAGHGGSIAAPIARKILDAYFEGKKLPKPAQVAVQIQPEGKIQN